MIPLIFLRPLCSVFKYKLKIIETCLLKPFPYFHAAAENTAPPQNLSQDNIFLIFLEKKETSSSSKDYSSCFIGIKLKDRPMMDSPKISITHLPARLTLGKGIVDLCEMSYCDQLGVMPDLNMY